MSLVSDDRRARRRPIVFGVCMIVTAAAIAIFVHHATSVVDHGSGTTSITTPSAADPGNVIPWSDQSADATMDGAATASEAPECDPRNLQAEFLGGGGAGETFYVPIHVTNASASPCIVDDSTVLVRWKAGESSGAPDSSAVLFEADGVRIFQLAFRIDCQDLNDGDPDTSRRMSIEGVDISSTGDPLSSLVANCRTASVIPVAIAGDADSDSKLYAELDAEIGAQSVKLADDQVSFRLKLSNRGSAAVLFGDCPTFKEVVTTASSVDSQTYVLNCRGIRIGRKMSVEFDMRARLDPSNPRPLRVGWFMDNGPSAIAVLR